MVEWLERCLLPLAKLTSRHSKDLITKLAGDEPLPEDVLQEILVRCDGIPLFAEERHDQSLMTGRLEGGQPAPSAARHSGSSTFQFTSRFPDRAADQLPSGKRIAQIAALLGRSIDYETLAAVLNEDEDALQSALAELVRRVSSNGERRQTRRTNLSTCSYRTRPIRPFSSERDNSIMPGLPR